MRLLLSTVTLFALAGACSWMVSHLPADEPAEIKATPWKRTCTSSWSTSASPL